ncbi:putative 60S ribosomal protein RL27 [Paratrimastix pyriformis]|uniref:60S ribosomal protein RL27 n=1 Tax=Paratrimastix pyriformis TaxID=342808 RepID=A0ABQ8UVH3_9EUKA|nr:putative 60S ribosomal protein RL27 [Paratrimastix pyriformis]
MKFLKPGKVVILLNGRYAGKKAVIVKTFDDGTDAHHFGHCLVAGIRKNPLRVTKDMSKKTMHHRSSIKPFVKMVNFSHIMPTRYQAEMNLKDVVVPDSMADLKARREVRKEVRKVFQAKYLAGENKWFFEKLHF